MATGGRLVHSARHRGLYAPLGLGDELRGVFRAGGECWGQVCLTRVADAPWFSAAEAGQTLTLGARTVVVLRQ